MHDQRHACAGGEERQDLLQSQITPSHKDRGLLILRRFVVAGQASTTMLVHSFTLVRHCQAQLVNRGGTLLAGCLSCLVLSVITAQECAEMYMFHQQAQVSEALTCVCRCK